MLGLLAHVLHTPLPTVAQFTLGQVSRYMAALPSIAAVSNPFIAPKSDDEKPITDPEQIKALARNLNIRGATKR